MTRGIPEPPPVPVIEELEAAITDLIVLMDTVRGGSAEYRMMIRQLIGVRDGGQLARDELIGLGKGWSHQLVTGRSLSNNSLENSKCSL